MAAKPSLFCLAVMVFVTGCVSTEDPVTNSSVSSSSIATSSESSSIVSSVSSTSAVQDSSIPSSSSRLPSSSSVFSESSASSSSVSSYQFAGVCEDKPEIYGPRLVRLLSAQEVQNTLEDLAGIDFDVRTKLPTDDVIDSYVNNFAIKVSDDRVDAYLAVAETTAGFLREKGFSPWVGNCDITENSCLKNYIKDFASRAYRRPVSADEQNAIFDFAKRADLASDNTESAFVATLQVLTSPKFLFRFEQGEPSTTPPAIAEEVIEPVGTPQVKNANQQILAKNRTERFERLFDIYSDGTQLILEAEVDIVDGKVPQIAIELGNARQGLVALDKSGKQTYSFFYSDFTDGKQHVRVIANRSDNEGSESSVKLLSVSIGKANKASVNIPVEPTEDEVFELTPFELAGFLSYTYLGSMPDNILWNAAKNDQLGTVAQIENQIKRMMTTDRGKAQLIYFADQWLDVKDVVDSNTVAKDPNIFPDFDQPLRDAMAKEIDEMFLNTVLTNTPFKAFIDTDTVTVNRRLAQHYGLDFNSSDPEAFDTIPAGQHRGGFVTSGAFLSKNAHPDHTSPVHRAQVIRERLLCQIIPPPPPGIDLLRADAAKTLNDDWSNGRLTSREFFGELTSDSQCDFCHIQAINPLGFGLEDFDPVGKHRTVDHRNLAINADGVLFGSDESAFANDSVSFSGAKSLAKILADNPRTGVCFSENLFRYMLATGPQRITRRQDVSYGGLVEEEREDYACAINGVSELLENNQQVDEVFKKLGSMYAVRYRKERSR